MPDAYLSETLHAPTQGVGVVTRPGYAPALTWDGHQVGQVTAAHLGGYRFSPALTGRVLGPIVTPEQLEVLAARFGQGGRGLDLRAPARLTMPAVPRSLWYAPSWPSSLIKTWCAPPFGSPEGSSSPTRSAAPRSGQALLELLMQGVPATRAAPTPTAKYSSLMLTCA